MSDYDLQEIIKKLESELQAEKARADKAEARVAELVGAVNGIYEYSKDFTKYLEQTPFEDICIMCVEALGKAKG